MKKITQFSLNFKQFFIKLGLLGMLFFSSNPIIAQRILPQPNLVLGERSVLWIRGEDPAAGSIEGTEEKILEAREQFNNYIRKVSYGKASIKKFDITPIYNFSAASGGYQNQLNQSATAGGFDVGSYNIIFYHFKGDVSIGGGATGGGNGLRGSVNLPDAVIVGEQYKGIIHEGIHAMGIGHSEGIEGKEGIFPGVNLGGVDPYHFMGSEGAAGLDADLTSYFKYSLGWIDPASIEFQPIGSTDCKTFRMYQSSDLTSVDNSRTYGLQYGPEFWLTYVPSNFNPKVVKNGLLMYWQPTISPDVNRLLDLKPESLRTVRANDVNRSVADFWDAALQQGEEVNFGGDLIKVIEEGGSGNERWVEFQICSCISVSGDSDNDGVCDSLDQCEGQDDKIDADLDGIPDVCDVCPNDSKNDANKNAICDNIECTIGAKDFFEYTVGIELSNVTSSIGNSNWIRDWKLSKGSGSKGEVAAGVLDYSEVENKGNHIKVTHLNNSQTTVWQRDLNITLDKGDVFWVDFLVRKNNNDANSNFLVVPGNDSNTAIGIGVVEVLNNRRGGQLRASGLGIQGKNNMSTSFDANQTYWVVGKYTLKAEGTAVEVWIDPAKDSFDEENPDIEFESEVVVDEASSISVLNRTSTNGSTEYEIDALQLGCDIPMGLNDCTLSGTACDDNNSCTINDVYNDSCNCFGTYVDTDNDGICNAEDTENQSCDLGTACDDNDACTTNDKIDNNCDCVGEIIDANNNNVCDTQECDNEAYEDFDYPTTSKIEDNNGGLGFSGNWELLTTEGDVEILDGSIEYESFESRGGRLRLTHTFGSDIILKRNFNKNLIETEKELWVSCLFRPVSLQIGRVEFAINDNAAVGFNKRRGFVFALDRDTDNVDVVEVNETYWLVAQYIFDGGVTKIKLWVNPTTDSFDLDTPNVSKEIGIRVPEVNFLTIKVQKPEDVRNDKGIYEIDEIRYGCNVPFPLNINNLNCTGANSVVPLYTINGKEFLGDHVIDVEEGMSLTLKARAVQELSGAEDNNTYTITDDKGNTFNNEFAVEEIKESDAGFYTISNQLGCSANFKINISKERDSLDIPDLGGIVEEQNNVQLQLYPNPASDKITLLLNDYESYNIEFYDINGRLLKKEINKKIIDVNTFIEGLYVVKITVDDINRTYFKKLIISK